MFAEGCVRCGISMKRGVGILYRTKPKPSKIFLTGSTDGCVLSLFGCSSVYRQANHKFCSAAIDVAGLDGTAEAFGQPPDLPETDADAVGLGGLKGSEKTIGQEFRWDAGAAVGDFKLESLLVGI